MINILIRIIAEGAKAAAPHVARHAHHVVRPAAGHVTPLLIPKIATGGASAGAVAGVARGAQIKGKAIHAAASGAAAQPHVSSSTARTVAHFAESTAEETVAAEGLALGGKAVVKKARAARHQGPDEAAQPITA
jgi:hypothetical protein